jgi:6-phosphogluconolactonase
MVHFSPDRKFVLSNEGMTRCILIIQSNSVAQVVKDSFAVEAGSGPRHLTFSKKGGMFMYYRNLLEV